jgi:hypothetical protein
VTAAGLARAALLLIVLVPGAARSVAGRVVRPAASGKGVVAVPAVWVVLHRVGSDTARPLDSVRSGPDGRYAMRYETSGVEDALYFVAVRYSGIAYFSPPLRDARVSGGDAEITVYDTISAGAPLRDRGRHVILFAPRADGSREVVEVYEIENEGSRTRVAAGDGRPAWSAPLPAAATDVRAGQSDVSAAAIVASAGTVQVFAPFAPGIKQVSFTYRLPKSAFPLALPPSRDSAVLELLIEEHGASPKGAGLRAVDSVTVDNHHFSRWLSPSAPAGAAVHVTTAEPAGGNVSHAVIVLAVLMGGAMLTTAFIALRKRH